MPYNIATFADRNTSRMDAFETRRDRFAHFDAMQNPAINLTFRLEVPDFLPACKAAGRPPFHFFLFALLRAVMQIDHFRYRKFEGQIIKIDRLFPSFAVMDDNNNLNFARFTGTDDLDQFIARSQAAKAEACVPAPLHLPGAVCTPRELKDHVWVTCMPWLELLAIEHPMAQLSEADIPMIAWGKFRQEAGGKLSLPIAVQAHHGFVDGYHIHLLGQEIGKQIGLLMR
jgi:chloramphenicol O-acetyltransferase type A